MTVIVWPSELPQRMTWPDFSAGLPDGRLQQSMEVGPRRFRRRVSAAATPVTGLIVCTLDELAHVETFWNEDCEGGSLPFLFPDQLYDGVALTNEDGTHVTNEDGLTLLAAGWWLVQFADAPRRTQFQNSLEYAATLSLNILP